MLSTKIGNRRVVFSETLLIPDGERALVKIFFPAELGITEALLEVAIVTDLSSSKSPGSISWGEQEGTFTITLHNLPHLEASTKGYIELASIDDKQIAFAAFYHRVGQLTSLKLVIAVEG